MNKELAAWWAAAMAGGRVGIGLGGRVAAPTWMTASVDAQTKPESPMEDASKTPTPATSTEIQAVRFLVDTHIEVTDQKLRAMSKRMEELEATLKYNVLLHHS